MFLFSYTSIILSILCLGVSFFIFFKKNYDQITIYFCIHIFFVSIWIGSNGFADLSKTDFYYRFWSGLSLIGGMGYISAFMSFLESFLTGKKLKKIRLILLYFPTIVSTLIAFTKFYVEKTIFLDGQTAQGTPGIANYPIMIIMFLCLYYVLRLSKQYFTVSSYQRKKQIFYITSGFIILYIAAIIFTLIFPLIGELRFFTIAPQFAVFTIIATAYAIYKHKLLEIKIAIQLSIIYTIIILIIGCLYLLILYIFISILPSSNTQQFFYSSIISTILGILTTPLLIKYFKIASNHLFFRKNYDLSEAVEELSNLLNKYNTIEEILENSRSLLEDLLHSKDIHFTLIHKYTETIEFNNTTFLPLSVNLPNITPFYKLERLSNHPTNPFLIISPLIIEEEIIGYILISEKLSGIQYTDIDCRLIKIFSSLFAITLKKVYLYQQVIDHSKNLTKKITEKTKEIKSIQENQSQLMIDITHELQTPLTIIKGEIYLLKKNIVNNTPLNNFEKTIDDISYFIHDLLRLSRLESKPSFRNKTEINLSKLIDETVKYILILANINNVKIVTELIPNIIVNGVKEELKQLLLNLLNNSIKYTANERLIKITLSASANKVQIIIKDTGKGMHPKQISNLFKRFNRLGRTNEEPGTGLGLAICEQIIKNHNGTISVTSQINRGSIFTINLPKT